MYKPLPKYNEILKIIQENKFNNDYETVNIAFLSNITIDTVINYLRYFSYSEKLNPLIYQGEYDNILQEVMIGESGLYKHNPHFIILCLKKETLCEKLVYEFTSLSEKEIEEEVKRVLDFFDTVLTAIRKYSPCPVFVNNFDSLASPSFGILDYQDKNKQLNSFRRLNLSLIDLANTHKSVYIVDVEHLEVLTGHSLFIDNRYWHTGKAPYTRKASELIAWEYMKFIRALKGMNKKCLVLDCDNTLWKGILGEDGFNKILMDNTFPGSLYLDFQKFILDLHNMGVILALCSKNNEEDVLEVFDKHPHIFLKKEHFALMKINWKNKAENIKEIAEELNIGLDSIVFIDDSSFEIEMVSKLLPQVETLQVTSDPSCMSFIITSSGLFDSLVYSSEDRKRNEMYRTDGERKKAASSLDFKDIYDYYRYLEMEITISSGDEFSIPRISQLTQRTNQFNLTTRRYSEKEIEILCLCKNADVRYLSLKDRFGDMGIVGVAILKYEKDTCFIEAFLMSCRAIGRGVEDVLLRDCIVRAEKKGCKTLTGLYIPTMKNKQVDGFYEKRCFRFLEKSNEEYKYIFDLEGNKPDVPDYFKLFEV